MQVRHIAIIGLGSIGKRHLKVLRALDSSIKISIVKKPETKAVEEEALADNVFYSLDDAIKSGIQAAIICSPAPFHVKQAAKLMAAKVHLLIEKPLSDQIDGLDLFQKSVNSSNIILTVGYVLRFKPELQYLCDFLKKTNIGKISEVEIRTCLYLPDWRPGRDYKETVSAKKTLGGGVLLELSHELDYMLWLFSAAKSVSAIIQNKGMLGIEAEEEADLNIVTEKDINVRMHLDFISKEQKRYCTVVSEKGIFTCDFLNKEVNIEFSGKERTEKKFNYDYDYPYTEQMKSFLNAIETRSVPLVTLEDAAKTVYLIDAAKKSGLSGKTEKVLYVK